MKKQERDYSHRSRLDKLGVKEGLRVSILGMRDKSFFEELTERPLHIARERLLEDSDLIFYEANSAKELKMLRKLKRSLKQNGAIWVVSLKGKHATIKDVDVIAAAKEAGLVDNKVVGFSDTHTSLRIVIPVKDRR